MEENVKAEQQTLVNVGEAARYLGVSAASLRLWSDQGRLSVYRTPGGQRRFRVDDLESFLDGMRQRQTVSGE